MPTPPPPPVQVTAWWTLTGPQAVVWTVEDDTLGAPDVTPIAGDLETDVSAYVLPGVSITRGRNRQTDTFSAGSAVVRLNNRSRTFDPFNDSSPFTGNIIPGKKFSIRRGNVTLFTGRAMDYDYTSAHNQLSVAEVSLEDSLSTLARASMDEWTPIGDTASAQINEALDRPEVNFTANRNITGGVAILGDYLVDANTNVLDFVQTAARSDLGRLFADRNDVVVFKDRLSAIPGVSDAEVVYFGDSSLVPDPLTDEFGAALTNGTGDTLLNAPPAENVDRIPFAEIQLAYGSDILFTRTVVSRVDGSTEIVDDLEGIQLYGQLSTQDTYTNLFLSSDEQSADLADFLANSLSDPELRIASVTVKLGACQTATQQGNVLALDIGSLVNVRYTPDAVGVPIERYCVVEGIRHDITRLIDHDIELLLGDAQQFGVWTLEDPLRGAFDQSPIAF